MAISKEDFAKLVLVEFPQLQADVDEWSDLWHLQMMEFAILTCKAAEAGDQSVLERSLRLADRFLREGDDQVRNAVHVSFLESLPREGDSHDKIWTAMSPALRAAWRDLIAYLSNAKK